MVLIMKIITHSGPFHCDDVMACALLAAATDGGRVEIKRTRDSNIISPPAPPCGWRAAVVDVGGVYDPANQQFDHHFLPPPMREDGTKLASAGMVFEALKSHWMQGGICPLLDNLTTPAINRIDDLVRKVDAADNGVKVEGWSLSETVHKCNPVGVASTPENFDHRFGVLVEIFRLRLNGSFLDKDQNSFVEAVTTHPTIVGWVSEHDAAMAASEDRIRHAFGQPGSNLVLKEYEVALFSVGAEAPAEKLYSIFPSPGGEWMVQQIPITPGAFEGRKPLPAAWAGKRGEDLDAVTGVEGGVFVHPGRFIGGHKTLEGALALADLAARTPAE